MFLFGASLTSLTFWGFPTSLKPEKVDSTKRTEARPVPELSEGTARSGADEALAHTGPERGFSGLGFVKSGGRLRRYLRTPLNDLQTVMGASPVWGLGKQGVFNQREVIDKDVDIIWTGYAGLVLSLAQR